MKSAFNTIRLAPQIAEAAAALKSTHFALRIAESAFEFELALLELERTARSLELLELKLAQ